MGKYRYYLGIDTGGTLVKAALFDPDSQELAQASRKTTLLMPHLGFTERDMGELREATFAVIGEAVRKSGIDPSEIAAISATGHGNGLYLLDKGGSPVRNGIVSTDSRALSCVKKWEREGVLDVVLPKTMQSVWAGSAVSLLTGMIRAEITDMSGTNLLNVRDGHRRGRRRHGPRRGDARGRGPL